jgi:serine/threonine protein kinase
MKSSLHPTGQEVPNAYNLLAMPSGSKEPSPGKTRTTRDPLPTTLEGVREELEHWESRQGEGLPGSDFEESVRNRLSTLRHREQRYRDAGSEQTFAISLKGASERLTFHTAFSSYRVVGAPLGGGGAGIVYEVQDADGERYALKVINSEAGTVKIRRFKNEIAFCSKNTHKNIITVSDYGVVPGSDGKPLPFYVMPLFPTTLRKQMSHRLPISDVLGFFSQVLDGVEAAHLNGVCHRDLKPENILCDSNKNLVVIADFGIARFKEEDLYTAVETSDRERLANFLYSAPEQRVRGKAVTNKADIFALGLILNEMFTGDVPQGAGYKRIAAVSGDHEFLDDIVDQMIQQLPEQRPDSVTKLKEELIARGNQFVRLQHLDQMKKEVVPESDITDPLIADPVRLVEKEDYRNGTLTLRLNQAVNDKWVECFQKRSTRFSANVSSALVSFHRDRVNIIVTEHFVQEGVRFVKEYLQLANEEYAAQVKQESLKEIERRRAALRTKIAQEEERIGILQKIDI